MKGCVLISTEILLGWLSLLCFIFSCSYSVIKRKNKFRSKNKISLKNLLNYHCYIAVIATILAFIHAGKNLTNFKLSTGYIALILMILITLIGILILHVGNYFFMQFLM